MASVPRLRHFLRSLRRFNLTILCGVLTILTLRGTLGAGKFGTPNQDFHHLRHHFRRVLTTTHPQPSAAIRSSSHAQTPPESGGGGGTAAPSPHLPASIGGAAERRRIGGDSNSALQGEDRDPQPSHAAAIRSSSHAQTPPASGDGGMAAPPLHRPASIDGAAEQRRRRIGGDSNSALQEEEVAAAESPAGVMLLFDARAHRGSPCAQEKEEEALLHQSIKNKVDYCRIHGIDMFYGIRRRPASDLSTFLSHSPPNATERSAAAAAAGRRTFQRLMKRLMASHPDVEWFWWIDFDAAVFTNMSLDLATSKYDRYNAVLFRRPAPYVNGSSSFLLRNCEWSVELLDRWAAGNGESISSEMVMVESSEDIHGLWVEEEEEGEQSRPLMTDFGGCSKKVDCRKQKRQALQLAEEQVRIWYGMESGGGLRQNHHSLA